MRLYFALTLAFVISAVAGGRAEAATLKDIRFGVTSAEKTRIVFDIEGRFDYDLGGDGQGAGRLIVSLSGLKGKDAVAESGRGDGHVAAFRRTGGRKDQRRYLFEFARTARIDDVFVLEPRGDVRHRRLVIDLASSNEAEFLASLPLRYDDLTAVIAASTSLSPSPSPSPSSSVVRSDGPETRSVQEPAAKAQKPSKTDRAEAGEPARRGSEGELARIVIDAGHGGGDPGAKGPKGALEKTVTLAAALKLAEILRARGGYEVILTREDDSRLGVHDRARLAREAKPDLFISLHADAIADKTLRGGSIYTLSKEGKDRSVEEAIENGDFLASDLRKDHEKEVGGILHSLAHRETLNASSKFATILVDALEGEIPLVNNTLRQKDLRVLLAPDVPAVLLELAFISNEKDEANLTSKTWRARTCGAVADAIDAYFGEQSKMPSRAAGEVSPAG